MELRNLSSIVLQYPLYLDANAVKLFCETMYGFWINTSICVKNIKQLHVPVQPAALSQVNALSSA